MPESTEQPHKIKIGGREINSKVALIVASGGALAALLWLKPKSEPEAPSSTDTALVPREVGVSQLGNLGGYRLPAGGGGGGVQQIAPKETITHEIIRETIPEEAIQKILEGIQFPEVIQPTITPDIFSYEPLAIQQFPTATSENPRYTIASVPTDERWRITRFGVSNVWGTYSAVEFIREPGGIDMAIFYPQGVGRHQTMDVDITLPAGSRIDVQFWGVKTGDTLSVNVIGERYKQSAPAA